MNDAGRERDVDDFERLAFDQIGQPVRELPPVSSLPLAHSTAAPIGVVEFSEASYLRAFADVRQEIADGTCASALEHYNRIGRAEYRLAHSDYLRALAGGVVEQAAHGSISFNIDACMASVGGTLFVVGWTDDRENPLVSLSAVQGNEGWNTRGIGRCRRADVDDLLQAPLGYRFGYWITHRLGHFDASSMLMLRARFADGRFTQVEIKPRVMSDTELRDTVLSHFATLQYPGNRDIESGKQLDSGVGAELVALNRSITGAFRRAAHVEHYGPARSRFSSSYIVCLLGKPEYFFLQNALFRQQAGRHDVEFVYVSNSPELTEVLQKEALIAERIYGHSLTLVTLPGNAGFSAANNAAAHAARSDRLVFINPDVFPRDDGWCRQHAAIVEGKPKRQTALFGAPLYYDDGSLMHGGMYFEIDRGLSVTPTGVEVSGMIRVEHYGKGAPEWSDRYTRARPVPAVTGAFISADRNWFELLGGFTEDYIFGHYEDADLCLKSLKRGLPVWVHDVRFWHLEGKGSVRRPAHEGGSLVNRWLFSRTWRAMIEDGLVGRNPQHALIQARDGEPPRPRPIAQQLPQSESPNPSITPLARPRPSGLAPTKPAVLQRQERPSPVPAKPDPKQTNRKIVR